MQRISSFTSGKTAQVVESAINDSAYDVVKIVSDDIAHVTAVSTAIGNGAFTKVDMVTTEPFKSNIDIVSGINGAVTTVAGLSTQVTALSDVATSTALENLSGNSADLVALSGNSADLTALGGNSTNLSLLGTLDAVSDMNTLAVPAIITDMDIVSTNIANVNVVGSAIDNVNTTATNIASINTVANVANLADIVTVADDLNSLDLNGIADVVTVATDLNKGLVGGTPDPLLSSVNNVSNSIDSVNTVSSVSSQVTTLAPLSAEIAALGDVTTSVALDRLNTGGTAASIDRLNTLGTANSIDLLGTVDVVSDINILGTLDAVADMNTLAAVSGAITTSAANIASINTVAADLNESVSEINTVAVSIANVDTVGTAITAVNTVSTDIANVNTTAASIANVNAVGVDLLEPVSEINTVATSIANVNLTGGSIAGVNTVAADIVNVNTVATDLNEPISEINTVAVDIANVNKVGTDIANVNTVATSIANVNTTVANIANVNAVGLDLLEPISEINTVAASIANVDTVSGSIASVTTVATDLDKLIGTNQPTDSAILNALTNATDSANSATNAQLSEWEAEASRLTATSYAVEAENVLVNLVTSNGDGTYTYTPQTGVYSSLHYESKYTAFDPAIYQTRNEDGVANGYASLDNTGLVPASQLPSYVDDVIEVATYADLPLGTIGFIYIVVADETKGGDTSTYRWTGSVYALVSNTLTSLDVKNLYEGNTDTNVYTDAEKAQVVTNTSGIVVLDSRATSHDVDIAVIKEDIGNLTDAIDGGGDVAGDTHAAPAKATPVDLDEIPLVDSAASFGLKKLLWSDLKATLEARFDSLYMALSTNQTIAGIKTFTSFMVTPEFPPTADYQVANKKYVDDNLTVQIVAEANSQAEEDAAFTAGAVVVVRTDLIPIPYVVQLLLHMDGTDGGTTFIDSSYNGFTVTAESLTTTETLDPADGTAFMQSTATPTSSAAGADRGLKIADDANLRTGTDDFTIEAYFRLTDSAIGTYSEHHTIASKCTVGTEGDLNGWYLGVLNGTNLVFSINNVSQLSVDWVGASLNLTDWFHVSVNRVGTTTTMYVNGVAMDTKESMVMSEGVGDLMIGRWYYYTDHTYNTDVDEFQMVTAGALRTEAFTPSSTALGEYVGSAELLLHMDGLEGGAVFEDSSKNGFTITKVGLPTTTTASPVLGTASMLNANSTNYITVADDPALRFGTNDFTMECFFKPTSISTAAHHFIASSGVSGGLNGWYLGLMNGANITFAVDNTATLSVSTAFTPVLGVWSHISLNRVGDVYSIYINGVFGGSTTSTSVITEGVSELQIGRWHYSTANTHSSNLDEFYIQIGSALRTANFTPPTVPFVR